MDNISMNQLIGIILIATAIAEYFIIPKIMFKDGPKSVPGEYASLKQKNAIETRKKLIINIFRASTIILILFGLALFLNIIKLN